ncbi:MAG: hypothetical protein DWI22_00940 [Planctomycetota bacterium]|nr:MAG: hypothetical protein DWI22_00940 [Planctomycetota bacterium]
MLRGDVEFVSEIGSHRPRKLHLKIMAFHALEAHQCLLERRGGGETGVAAVRTVLQLLAD